MGRTKKNQQTRKKIEVNKINHRKVGGGVENLKKDVKIMQNICKGQSAYRRKENELKNMQKK